MTLQKMVEDVNAIFPKMGFTQILAEFDLAQKTLCSEAGLIESSGALSDVSSYTSWALPTGFVTLKQIDFYDTDGNPLYIEDLNIDYEINDGTLYFLSTTTTPLESMPSSITDIILRYEKMPSDITTINSTVDIDEVEYPALQALVLERLYSKTPVPTYVDKEGNPVSVVNLKLAKYWGEKYYKLKVEAKKRNNLIDNTHRDAVYYPSAGKYFFFKRTKETAISSIDIPSYSTLYSKYVRFSATSPSTITEIFKLGFGDLTYAMDGNDIVITSSGEFTVEMWADDIQNSSFRYVNANEFRFTPEPVGDWNTSVFELWIY